MNRVLALLTSRLPARLVLALCLIALFGGFALREAIMVSGGPRLVEVRDAVHVPEPSERTDPVVTETGVEPEVPADPLHAWRTLVDRLVLDGHDQAEVENIFRHLDIHPQPEFMGQKAIELFSRFGKASLAVPERQNFTFTAPDYTRMAGGVSLAAGKRAMENNKKFFDGLFKQYGVPSQYIVAVMMVETGLGMETGRQPALLALGSMSVTSRLEHVRPVVRGIPDEHEELDSLIQARSDWAYGELKALLDYAKASGKDVWTIPGSIYGAIGICQFMPSNIRRLGASTSKDRPVADVFRFTDAAASIARYLSAHGWRQATTPAAKLAVLRAYNHSNVYASTVYGVAMALTSQSPLVMRNPGNIVKAARDGARGIFPATPAVAQKKIILGPPIKLQRYSDLLK